MKFGLVSLTVLGLLLSMLSGCSYLTGKTTGQSLDDTVITGDIKGKILKDRELKTFAIDVNSYKGDVTVSGQVPNKAAEQRLIDYVRNTKGVKSVKTNLEIAGTEKTTTAAPTQPKK
ncbi:MAG: periplasmic protein [Syntrophorhabdaceae bacterium PtaU1.Bin034]|jgi:osmotically-inducible protein OsmY|nr:MAG: periplasmic protein [Syntrophorhabdaceae bacterium PtaU1.Bin034]